jgi:hypothetical protein
MGVEASGPVSQESLDTAQNRCRSEARFFLPRYIGVVRMTSLPVWGGFRASDPHDPRREAAKMWVITRPRIHDTLTLKVSCVAHSDLMRSHLSLL